MKKKYLNLLVLFSFIIGLIPLASCSDNDDEESGNGENNSGIVGTWKTVDDDDVYVFKSDGTGIGCEHTEDVEQDLWTFRYEYSEKDKTIKMMYDGKTDVLTNVEINGKMLVGIDSDNNDRFLLNRQENPIGILTLDAGNDDTYNGDVYRYGSETAGHSIDITSRFLWHKDYFEEMQIKISDVVDYSNMMLNYAVNQYGNKASLTFELNRNDMSESRSAIIRLTALDSKGNGVSSIDVKIYQESKGMTFEIVPPSEIPANGGTVAFLVYNKDNNNINVRYPSEQSVNWTKLYTNKYPEGEDWKLNVTANANTSGYVKTFTYIFSKNDGSLLQYTLRQEPTYSGGGSTTEDDGWVSVTASGYAPYYYCPTDRTTTPSRKVPTSNLRAYKNKSTGAYKINWGGRDYPCHRGFNKLTLETHSHTTQNAFGKIIVCTDYLYFEFTISD